jgi:hypothetical protein
MRDLVKRNLGNVLLRTDGKHGCKVGTIACEVIVELDPDIEFEADGKVEFAQCYFWVYFKSGWDYAADGHPYRDDTFERGVQNFLALNGLPTQAGWSEQGRQDAAYADFDCDYNVLEAMFPDTFAAARAKAMAA